MKLDFYSGSVETDTTHDLQVSIRLHPRAEVRMWHRARFPSRRTVEGVHGIVLPIEDGWLKEAP